jgi:HSP20 family protein
MNAGGRCSRSFHSPFVVPLCVPRSSFKTMAQRWDPIRDLVSLQDRMNRLFQEATERRAGSGDEENEQEIEHADWIPAADVYQTETEYVVAVDLPGINRETLDINLDNDRLVIRGERAVESDGQHRVERPHGRFLRRFGVPATVNQEAIAAEYKDGVLRVRLPKREEQKARRVEIKVS